MSRTLVHQVSKTPDYFNAMVIMEFNLYSIDFCQGEGYGENRHFCSHYIILYNSHCINTKPKRGTIKKREDIMLGPLFDPTLQKDKEDRNLVLGSILCKVKIILISNM